MLSSLAVMPGRKPVLSCVKGAPAIDPVRSTTNEMSSGTTLQGEHADADVLSPMLPKPSTLRKYVGTDAFCLTVIVFGPLQGKFGLATTQLVVTVWVTFPAGTPAIRFLPPVDAPYALAWAIALAALAG